MKLIYFFTSLGLGAALLHGQTPPPVPGHPPVPGATAPSSAMAMADPNKVVLAIGDEKITAGQYEAIVSSLPPQYQASARGGQKRQFAERIVQLKVLSKEAQKRSIDQQATVKQQLAFDRENVLANALFQDLLKTAKVDAPAEQKYYNEHKGDYEEVKGRHILIRMKGSAVPLGEGKKELTDEEALAKAQEVKKKLAAGADFATVAKAESDDTGSGANGGDLGIFKHGQMVAAFEQAAFALPAGQVSDPVKTQFGYHLIRVDSKKVKTFDEARPEIDEKLRPELAKKEMDELRKKAAVTVDDAYFGPATAEQ